MSGFSENEYWLGFSVFSGIGPKRFSLLLEAFGSAESAWNADAKEFEKVAKPAITKQFVDFKKKFSLEQYLQQLSQKQVWFVTLGDKDYPKLLNEIKNPPFVLHGIGDKSSLVSSKTIGVVGTRKITNYGRQVTQMITEELVDAGYCIVSGLAMGVDAVAHVTALKDGKTVAVLGCGVDCCNPRSNQGLYTRIIESGSCVISEFPLSQEPTVGSFPSRNRIIAGISQAVVVTEGTIDSGALITAADGLKNNRPVFAIPGPITSTLSKGPNELLKKGAQLVTSGEDILKALGVNGVRGDKRDIREIKGETEQEQHIVDLLTSEELSFDELLLKTHLSTAGLNMLLSLMEMRGIITKVANGSYCLCT